MRRHHQKAMQHACCECNNMLLNLVWVPLLQDPKFDGSLTALQTATMPSSIIAADLSDSDSPMASNGSMQVGCMQICSNL